MKLTLKECEARLTTCICGRRNISMRDYQESVNIGQTDAGQSDAYLPLCFAGDTKMKAKSCLHRDSRALDYETTTVTVRPSDLIYYRQIKT